ncbi:O-antigen translocase [Proteus mirabilis]|uniref:O-antigen translocase n=1 Tax=Proteus mirabilis TaxID=584 RepID=UPI001623A64A|nr:O-antigen translocase [Proteus mirabilis]MBB6663353.1 O-antigen translocase [Proteus mirabilis]MBB6706783.1 O-antigen translocase [Proteus mirabilis]MBB6728895.1 O-antigen translocase [Proteus mirabilis]MBS3845418.1 O-antigen translocase [Proteus mirabilis]
MVHLTFAKITILSGIVTALRLLCGLLVSKVVAIYTGPAGVSVLGQLQSFVTFINGFIASQVSQGVNRYSAENKYNYDKAKKYWIAATKLSITACLFIMSIGIIFSRNLSHYLFQNGTLFWLVILALSVLPLNIINNIFLGVLNGLENYKKFFIANIFAIISSLISMIILVYFLGLNGALISAALNNAIAGTWLIFLIIKEPWFKLKYWFGLTSRKHLLDVSKYFLMGVIGALTGPISIIIVRTIITNDFSIEYSGYWQAVTKISEAYLAVLTTAMAVYYFPKTASANTVDEHLDILRIGIKIVVPLSMIMALSIFTLKDFIISLLFTKDFIPARGLFLFQNIGDFFRICSWLFATILLAKGYFLINATLEIFIAILFPTLVKLLISTYGFTGASIAYCITNLTYLLCTIIVYYWYIKTEVK